MTTHVEKKARKKMVWKTRYPNGQLDNEIPVIMSSHGFKMHGKVIKWHRNGVRMSITECEYGKKHGAYKSWHSTGTPEQEGFYKFDKKNGTFREWDLAGVKRIETTYVDGKENGVDRRWDEKGTLTNEIPSLHGKIHGPVRQRKEDGEMHTNFFMHGELQTDDVCLRERARVFNAVLASRKRLGKDVSHYIGAILREESWAYL